MSTRHQPRGRVQLGRGLKRQNLDVARLVVDLRVHDSVLGHGLRTTNTRRALKKRLRSRRRRRNQAALHRPEGDKLRLLVIVDQPLVAGVQHDLVSDVRVVRHAARCNKCVNS